MTTTQTPADALAALARVFAYDIQAHHISDALSDKIAELLNQCADQLEASARALAAIPEQGQSILYEHEDGRYAVDPDTTGDPKWHRMGPVKVFAVPAQADLEAAQRERMAAKFSDRPTTPATADFDLIAESDVPAQDAQGVHNEHCACSQWVIDYGHDLKRGEHHHRDCRKWHRVIGSAIVTKTEFMVLGDPSDDENHNCDAMGCSSVSHVLVRLPLAALRASSPADTRNAPLYDPTDVAFPAVKESLTVEQIEEAFQEAAGADEDTHIRFARGIEALHGIVTKERT